jgi:hypothetical protein
MNETHDGNINKSKQPAPEKGEGTSGSKSCNETATLRSGNLPKAEAVRTLSFDVNKGAAIKRAEDQNLSDGKTGKGNLAQVPVSRDNPTTTGSGN